MKILVSGGLGFIGHHVVRVLESFNHDVSIIDNKTDYGFISKQELDYIMLERFCRIKTRNINYNDIEKLHVDYMFKNVDIVIHLASFPRQNIVNQNPMAGSRVMSEGLLRLLELSVRNKVKKFVYVSSSMVYGNLNSSKFISGVEENFDCRPIGPYAIMKLAGEWLVEDYTRRFGIAHTIIRPSAVYGPYDITNRVVSKFLYNAMRDDELVVKGAEDELDFTYVDDVAMGIALAVTSENTDNAIYNITKSQSRSLIEAAELAIKIAGKGKIKIETRDENFPVRGQLNISRAKQDFGYDPIVSIEEGFSKYYDWLKKVNHE